jgi:hypothetical protein
LDEAEHRFDATPFEAEVFEGMHGFIDARDTLCWDENLPVGRQRIVRNRTPFDPSEQPVFCVPAWDSMVRPALRRPGRVARNAHLALGLHGHE